MDSQYLTKLNPEQLEIVTNQEFLNLKYSITISNFLYYKPRIPIW